VPDPSFPVTQLNGRVVVTTPAEIDIGNAGLLREALLAAAATGPLVIIVDMTRTEFCDSTGLHVLVRALKQANDDSSQLILVVRGSALRRILAVSGVGSMFRMYDSLDEAVGAAGCAKPASQ
jgi:anti-sigma B factor antagonist